MSCVQGMPPTVQIRRIMRRGGPPVEERAFTILEPNVLAAKAFIQLTWLASAL